MSAVVPTAPAAIIGANPFLYFSEYAVPRPIPAAQSRYCERRLVQSQLKILKCERNGNAQKKNSSQSELYHTAGLQWSSNTVDVPIRKRFFLYPCPIFFSRVTRWKWAVRG